MTKWPNFLHANISTFTVILQYSQYLITHCPEYVGQVGVSPRDRLSIDMAAPSETPEENV